MQENLCQEVIARNVPQLVELLLGSSIEGGGKVDGKVDRATFESCHRYAMNHLLFPYQEGSSPEAVWTDMNHFMERYRSEKLGEFGETFKQLASVVLNHPIYANHKVKNLQWRIMDFMLCVNYRAFRTVHHNLEEMDKYRKSILEALTLAKKGSVVVRNDVEQKDSEISDVSDTPKAEDNLSSNEETNSNSQSPSSKEHINSDSADSPPTNKSPDPEPIESLNTSEYRRIPSIKKKYVRFAIEQARKSKEKKISPVQEPIESLETVEHSYITDDKPPSNQIFVKEKFAMKEAKMMLKLNLTLDESTAERPTMVKYFKESNDLFSRIRTPWWHVDVHVFHPPEILASNFTKGYGDYLIYRLRVNRHSVRKISEEHQLLTELIVLFFKSVKSADLQMLDDKMELRTEEPITFALKHVLEGPHLGQIISSLKQMRHLRKFVESHVLKIMSSFGLETLHFFSVALRRLLRPVIEFLVYFEKRLNSGIEIPTLHHFIDTSRCHLERIQLLYDLSKETIEEQASMRALRVINTLFTNTSKTTHPKMLRSLSASLLLHSLESYCNFLDSWWSTGDFEDWHEEFPYQRILIEGRTEYTLRKLCVPIEELLSSGLFYIIQRHIFGSSEAVAILFDGRKISDFNSLHGITSQTSLHDSLISGVLGELAPYQIEKIEELNYAPDILQQLESSELDAVRRLFYSFHMETRPDPKRPVSFSIDELVRNFQACVHYTPISDIISQELQRLLHRRCLLANSYISDVVKYLQMNNIVRHIRTVYLLINYDLIWSELELFFEFLEKNQLIEASNKLKDIVVNQDPRMGYLFQVSLPKQQPELISLMVSPDPLLNRVISQEQFEQMNICFQLKLNLQLALYQLKKLPTFNNSKPERLVIALRSLQNSLTLALEEQLLKFDKINQILKDFYVIEPEINESTFLIELRINQELFMFRLKERMAEEFGGFPYNCSLQEVLSLSGVFRYRWLRVWALINDFGRQKARNIFEMKYDWLRNNYLQSTLKKCKAIGCVLNHR
nr:uncharacterized protein LOC108014458 [Drosophila suzukii]